MLRAPPEALNMRLAAGRFLTIQDTTSPVIAMLVNEAFVNAYFNDGRPAVGRRFAGMFAGMLGRDDAVVEVVGVVGDVLVRGLDQAPQPQIHVPHGVGFDIRHVTLVLRTGGPPATSAPLLTGIVQQLDPDATLWRVGPLTDRVGAAVEGPRFASFVIGAFAVLALSLATAGLYGVLSFGVNQRRREIGVRAALGATPGHLVVMVLKAGDDRSGETGCAGGAVRGLHHRDLRAARDTQRRLLARDLRRCRRPHVRVHAGYPSRRARDERLPRAHADPEFGEIVTAAERDPDTRLIESVRSLDLVPTDYSAVRW